MSLTLYVPEVIEDVEIKDSPPPYNTPSQRCCVKEDVYYHMKLIFLATSLYFVCVGLTSISLVFLINLRIAGDAAEPNSESVLVQTSVVFTHNACSFFCLRYNSGMGDYLGRKPLLCFGTALMILTRLLYTRAHRPAHFVLISIISGMSDNFYFSTLAWISDILPNHAERSKQFGLLAGCAGLSGVVIGAPVGAALSISVSPIAPFFLAAFFALGSFVVTFFNPCRDTLCLEHVNKEDINHISDTRALPKNWLNFISSHFPISFSTLNIMMSSSSPLDWVVFGLAQWTFALIPLILVQYLLKVFDWSRAITSLTLVCLGLMLGLLVPCLQNRYSPISLSFYSMLSQACGYLLLSIAGTGVTNFEYIGIAGLVMVGLGTSWLPCSQSIIISGYDFGQQGVITGLVGQVNDFAVLPAFLISLSFTFNLDRDGPVYWPGCAFGISTAVLVVAVSVLYVAHGNEAIVLKHRRHFKEGVDVKIPDRNLNFSIMPAESGETADSYEENTETRKFSIDMED